MVLMEPLRYRNSAQYQSLSKWRTEMLLTHLLSIYSRFCHVTQILLISQQEETAHKLSRQQHKPFGGIFRRH